MYGRHKSNDEAALSSIDDAFCHFHTFKDVFVLGGAGKMAKAKANALMTELVKKWKVDEETNAESWTLSKKWRKINA